MKRVVSSFLFSAALIGCGVHGGVAPWKGLGGGLLARFVQVGPDGAILARAITRQSRCPALTVDGAAQPMQVRAAPSDAYPVLACEATLPRGARAAEIDGAPLTLPPPRPARIAVIGDTGCRLKGHHFQACNDPAAWPLAKLARAVADWKPDLVVHVGDYHYRETACPPGNAGCAGSPTGDTWAAWEADFFAPAASLLTTAPWLFVRGNHEDCHRAGRAWFRFLDALPRPASGCEDFTEPYVVPAAGVSLLALDSSRADDRKVRPEQVEKYRAQVKRLAEASRGPGFLVTHKPFWAVIAHPRDPTKMGFRAATMERVGRAGVPDAIQAVIAGHIHLFEVLGFAGRPPTIVAGNSATLLGVLPKASFVGREFGGVPLAYEKIVGEFGFVTLEPAGDGWTVVARNLEGKAVTTCKLVGRSISCQP